MRAHTLLLPLALIACGKTQDDSTPTTGSWTDSSTAPTGTGTGTVATGTGTGTGTSDSGGSGGSGSSATITTFVGQADLDLGALTWTGTEAARVVSSTSGSLLCQWTWNAQDWAHDPAVSTTPEPAVAPCTDGDGNACLFAFTVNLSAGLETGGSCTAYSFATDAGAYHYGYSDDWNISAVSYGSQFAYYLPGTPNGAWFPVMQYGVSTWTPGTGQQGQLDYEILKTMLGTYIP